MRSRRRGARRLRDAVVGRARRDGGPSRRRAIPTPTTARSRCPPTADWIDPLIGLSFAAAATSTIRIATGVLLLPEHNPVLVAKQAATLDTLSGGRLTLGVGIGWSREEFDALGVPFERRGRAHRGVRRRHAHAVARRRRLVRRRVRPLRFGAGEPETRCTTAASRSCSAATATRRCAGWRHGATAGTASTSTASMRWPNASRSSRAVRRAWPRPHGAAARRRASRPEIRDVGALAELGVDELVVVDGPPDDARVAADWVSALADHWMSRRPVDR